MVFDSVLTIAGAVHAIKSTADQPLSDPSLLRADHRLTWKYGKHRRTISRPATSSNDPRVHSKLENTSIQTATFALGRQASKRWGIRFDWRLYVLHNLISKLLNSDAARDAYRFDRSPRNGCFDTLFAQPLGRQVSDMRRTGRSTLAAPHADFPRRTERFCRSVSSTPMTCSFNVSPKCARPERQGAQGHRKANLDGLNRCQNGTLRRGWRLSANSGSGSKNSRHLTKPRAEDLSLSALEQPG